MRKAVVQRFITGFSLSQYWARQIDLLLFFGETKKITGGRLYNQMKGSTDWLTVTGAVGSYTFQCPNTATYIAADTDYIWFKTDTTQRTATEAELVGYDFPRTPVKYDDAAPYSIRWIAILKTGVTLTASELNKLHQSFYLHTLWSGVLNAYGHIKGNKLGQTLWTPEPVATYYDTFTDVNNTKLVNHVPDVGGFTWIDSTATPNEKWLISSNKALITPAANAHYHAYFDTGSADVDISVDLTVPDGAYQGGFVIRRSGDSNFWRVAIRRAAAENVFAKIYKYTTEVQSTDAGAHAVGTKTLRCVVVGNNFTVYWDGNKIIDSYVSDGSWNTEKKHGLAGYYYSTWLQINYDEFKIV